MDIWQESVSRFGRQSVVTATEVLGELLTHAQFTRMLLDWDIEHNKRATHGTSLADRANTLARYARDNPDAATPEGQLWDAIVERAAALWQRNRERVTGAWNYDEHPVEQPACVVKLSRALNRDGFALGDAGIQRMLPDSVKLPEAQDEVDALLDKHGFSQAKGHLDQARNAHGRGEWAAANSQLRTFIDSVFDEIAERLDPARTANAPTGHQRRIILASLSPPFLLRDLNEWDDSGLGFVNGFMKRLHPQGSHPGLSDEDDCTFRLHVVLITSRLLLRRFSART